MRIVRGAALFVGLLALMLLAGCAKSAGEAAAKLADVRAGMTREEVLATLGTPQRQERYGLTEFLIYSTDGSSTTALLDFTPIAIVEGRVTGTGRKLYDAVVEAHTRSKANK
jgi:hypothetical protein